MSRLRLTSAETIGTAVLLLCIVVPVLFHVFSSPSAAGAAQAAQARADSVALARRDSLRLRADSLETASQQRRLRTRAKRDSVRKARSFRPDGRDRLRDVIGQ